MKTFVQKSALRDAFERARIEASTSPKMVNAMVRAAQHGSGEHREREWNAKLKFSTFNALKLKGVM